MSMQYPTISDAKSTVVPQYYDDAAGILRSIILSALAPHRLSMPSMPMPAFSMTPDQVYPASAR